LTTAAAHLSIPGERQSSRLWLFAGLVALCLHLGAAGLAAWALHPDISDDDGGAPAIELAMDMAASKSEQTDLPPGPEADASAAAPESAQSAPKAEAMDRPKEEAVESDNPDRLVAPEQAKRPEREPDEARPQPSESSAASVASEATAAPRQEATPEAPTAVAPVIGASVAAQRAKVEWQKRLFTHLSRHKRYPAGVRQKQAENRVVFTLDRTGRVVAARISASSGDQAFDNAALEMMKRSDPVPAPPPLLADETLTFEIPVMFRAPAR
jgi:periplasmic protein TonB